MFSLVKSKTKYQVNDYIEFIGYPAKIDSTLVMLSNQNLIDMYIKAEYEPSFNMYVYNIISFLDNNPSDDDATIMLNELKSQEKEFLARYGKYLSPRELELFLRKIRLLSHELKMYILQKVNTKNNSIGSSRGRKM